MRKKTCFGNDNFSNGVSVLYSDTANVGKIYTFFGTIIGILLAIGLFILGVYLVRKPPTFSIETKFTVTSAVARTVSNVVNNVPQQKTVYDLKGTVQNCPHEMILNAYSYPVSSGDVIKVYIQKDCQNNTANETSDDNKTVGWVLIFISILVAFFAGIKLFLTTHSKAYAAAEGVNAISNIFNHRSF
jgi:hypothetical protein